MFGRNIYICNWIMLNGVKLELGTIVFPVILNLEIRILSDNTDMVACLLNLE